MAKAKVMIDPVGNTLNIWWGNPKKAVYSEETNDSNKNDVLIKDKQGNILGVEIIGVFPEEVNISKRAALFSRIFKNKNKPFLLSS